MDNEKQDIPLTSPGVTETTQESPIPLTEELQQNASKKNGKIVKIAIYILTFIFLLALGAFGFWFYQKIVVNRPSVTPPSLTNTTPTPLPTTTLSPASDFYSLGFLLIDVTKGEVSSSFVIPSEYVQPNCEIQEWGGDQLPCDNSAEMITCAEYTGAHCRETNLLICGNIFSKNELLAKSVSLDFKDISLQCKNEVIDDYNLTRECYRNDELIYRCSGMSVPGIL